MDKSEQEYEDKILSTNKTKLQEDINLAWDQAKLFEFNTIEEIVNLTKKLECSSEQIVGIYFLIQHSTEESKNKIVYVGQSTNILFRIGAHTYEKKFDSMRYIECNEDLLNILEKHYIKKFSPQHNKQLYKNFKERLREPYIKLRLSNLT